MVGSSTWRAGTSFGLATTHPTNNPKPYPRLPSVRKDRPLTASPYTHTTRKPTPNHTNKEHNQPHNLHHETYTTSYHPTNRYCLRSEKLVLDGLSFHALPGAVVALCGPSGGGKSSCISLLERVYRPEAGSV